MASITTKVAALQELLASMSLEPSLRTMLGDSTNMTFSITIDAQGTSFSFSSQEPGGINENYNKRVPYVAATPNPGDSSPEESPQP